MTATGFEGLRPLLHLQKRRFVGRMRDGITSLKRPKRLLLVLLGLALVTLFVVGSASNDGKDNPFLAADRAETVMALFLTFFVLTTLVSSVAHGTMAFSPAEVQFLFPAPIGGRALICSHLLAAGTKAFTGALIFTLFLKPQGSGAWRVLLGYLLVFDTLVVLGLLVDLAHMHLEPLKRKRRAWVVGGGLLALAAMVIAATAAHDDKFSLETLRHVGLPGWLFAGILTADETSVALAHLAATLALTGGLTLACLSWKHPVRAGALHTSERMKAALERMGKGGAIPEKIREKTDGRLLPMLPRWGGAGAHVWRQLSALRRRRKAFLLLIFVPLLSATMATLAGDEPRPELGAFMAVVMLGILGPFYVQCDFRADHECLAWLRSFPTSATALAAGQLLASAFVVTGLQLVMGGWGVFLAPPERTLTWIVGLISLPVFNLIMLSVENAVFLVHPVRLDYRKGPPGALEIVRMYGVFLAKAVIMVLVLGMAALPSVGVFLATRSLGAAYAVGAVAFLLETALLVVIVGRLFRWVDPTRDLPGD